MELTIKDQKIIIDDKNLKEPSKEIRRQLIEYLESNRTVFELTVSYPDSFTGQVMREMAKIPYGETRTYGEIAEKLGTSPVAVGQACGRNPLPLIIPCHRVVSKNSIGGYHYGEQLKKRLLDLEAEKLNS